MFATGKVFLFYMFCLCLSSMSGRFIPIVLIVLQLKVLQCVNLFQGVHKQKESTGHRRKDVQRTYAWLSPETRRNICLKDEPDQTVLNLELMFLKTATMNN